MPGGTWGPSRGGDSTAAAAGCQAGRRRRGCGEMGHRAMAPAHAETRVLRGIVFIVLATVLFVSMNTGVKLLRPSLPTLELIWARTLGHLVFVFALFGPTHGGWRLLATRKPRTQIARSLLLLTSTSFFFTALGYVPLADATAVSFTAPLVVAALAGPMLAERVGLAHWLAIAAGFVGALIIIRPGAAGANPHLLLVLGSAACYAVYQILTRRMAAYDPPEVSVTYSAIVGTLVLSVAVPFFWRTPDRLSHWLILSAVGLLGGLGHYFVARAFLWGEASILSPFQYAQLIGAAGMGYLAFGDVPSGWTWGGAAVITASGLYIAWQESQRTRGVRAASRT
ncbi:MAG TPA: EamA/RhaT family transporter [Candidatus Rokubacteria bacterium]|nr:EamA/RhaT family transporter [Candidatus Rokubacteria bacterium]